MKRIIISLVSLLLTIPAGLSAEANSGMERKIDQRSYRLGGVGTFSELVRVEVKKLALSAAMLPAEMDDMEADIRRIAEEEGIEAYRDSDLIVTDLFPADVAKGKDVMLLYKGTTLDEYMALKEKKAALVKAGKYSGEARKDIAREFGRLLSYPENVIEEKINKNNK